MSDAVEVGVSKALLARVNAFASSQSPSLLTLTAYPNVAFTPPEPSKIKVWLRATILPVPTFEMAVAFDGPNRHSGILQIDTFQGRGLGEPALLRLAAQVIAYFDRGTKMVSDGVTVQVLSKPYRMSLGQDDNWAFAPVRIPYTAFI